MLNCCWLACDKEMWMESMTSHKLTTESLFCIVVYEFVWKLRQDYLCVVGLGSRACMHAQCLVVCRDVYWSFGFLKLCTSEWSDRSHTGSHRVVVDSLPPFWKVWGSWGLGSIFSLSSTWTLPHASHKMKAMCHKLVPTGRCHGFHIGRSCWRKEGWWVCHMTTQRNVWCHVTCLVEQ